MTDRREQWLRTLRHPYPFSARYPAPARRLQESRTWPRHGATARIASTVVNTAAVRRKEEKEEGELSSSDDDAVPSSLKPTGSILGKGPGSHSLFSSVTTELGQGHRRNESIPATAQTNVHPPQHSSFVNKSQLLSAISAQAPPLNTNRATASVAQNSSELEVANAISSGSGALTAVPDVLDRSVVYQQVQHIKSKIVSQAAESEPKSVSQPAQLLGGAKGIALLDAGRSFLGKGEAVQRPLPTTCSASINLGITETEKPSSPTSGRFVHQEKQPVQDHTVVLDGPVSPSVGLILSTAPSPVATVAASSALAVIVTVPVVASAPAAPPSFIPLLSAAECQAPDEDTSLPAEGCSLALLNAVVGTQTSVEGKILPLQGANSASANPAGVISSSGIPARKEAESFLASLRIPLAPAAMCSLPAVEDKEEAFVINFDDSSESDLENRLVGAGSIRKNSKAAPKAGNLSVQGSVHPGVQQGPNGAGVQKPAMLQSQIDQMKKQIAAMEQKGKPPVAPNPSKATKTSHPAVHRQPHSVATAANGDGDDIVSLRQTILQKENELEKERQRLGQISQVTRRNASVSIMAAGTGGKSSNVSTQTNSQKSRDANTGNSGSMQGRAASPYAIMTGGYATYATTGGQGGTLRPLNPTDFEQRGPGGNLFTPWASQSAATAPRPSSSGVPLGKSTPAAKQKRARAEKLAHDIKRLEAQIGSAKGKAVVSPKVQPLKRKQGAMANMFDNGIVSQLSLARTDGKRYKSMTSPKETYVADDHRFKFQTGADGQLLWPSSCDVQDSRHLVASKSATAGQTGYHVGSPSNVEPGGSPLRPAETEVNPTIHVLGQELAGPGMIPLNIESSCRRTSGTTSVQEGEAVHSLTRNRPSSRQGEEHFGPRQPNEAENAGTNPRSKQVLQVHQSEKLHPQVQLDASINRHAITPAFSNRRDGQVTVLQSQQQSYSMGMNATNLVAEVGHSHRQEDSRSLQQEEDLIDKQLEEAQERRRTCEVQERIARRAYREAQLALQAINSQCDYLHQKRENVAAQVRAAEIQHYTARAFVPPPRFLNEDIVSFDKDMSRKAPFFYSAPSTWTTAEPTTHQATVLLPKMGSMANYDVAGHENVHFDECHKNYDGSRVARETLLLQPLGASTRNHQSVEVTNEVRSSEVLSSTHEAHAVAQNTIPEPIVALTSAAGAGDNPIVGRKRAASASIQRDYEVNHRSTTPDVISDVPQYVIPSSELLSTTPIESLRSKVQVNCVISSPRQKTFEPLPPLDLALLKVVEGPGMQQEQGSLMELQVEEPPVTDHTGIAVQDFENETGPVSEKAVVDGISGRETTAPPEEVPCVSEQEPSDVSPITPSSEKGMHMSRKGKKSRQHGGRALKARKVAQKFRSTYCRSRESPACFKPPVDLDQNDSPASRASEHAPIPSASIIMSSPAADLCLGSSRIEGQPELLVIDSETTPEGNNTDTVSQSKKLLDSGTSVTHAVTAKQPPVSGPDDQPCQSSLDSGGIDDLISNRIKEAEPVVESSPTQGMREQSDVVRSKAQYGDPSLEAVDYALKTWEQDDSSIGASRHGQKDEQTEREQQDLGNALLHDSVLKHASESESMKRNVELTIATVSNILYEEEPRLSTPPPSDNQCDGDARGDVFATSLEDGITKGLDAINGNVGSAKILVETSCGTQVLDDEIYMGSSASTEMLAGHASDACFENAKQQNISEVDPATSDYLVISTFKGDLDLYVPSSALIINFSCLLPGENLAPLVCVNTKGQATGKKLRKAGTDPAHQHPWYRSPLSSFRSYRMFPWFNYSIESPTWSNCIDCFRPLCKFEHRGVCKDQECPLQHIRDYSMDSSQIMSQLHGYLDARNSSLSRRNVGTFVSGTVEEHGDSDGNPYAEAYRIVAEAQKMGFSIMKPPRCHNWKWARYVGHAPAYRIGSHVYKADDTVLKSPLTPRALPYSTLGAFQAYLLSPCASRPLPVNVPVLFEIGEKKGLFEKLVSNAARWSDLADGSEKQALAEGEPNDVELWLEVALDLINFDVNVEEQDKKASALFLLSRALEANSSSAVLWIVYLSVFYTKNGTEKDDLFQPAVDHSNCYELWRLFINTRSELNERLESYESALLRLGFLDDNSLPKKNSSYLLDLALQMLYCMVVSGKIDMALSWIDNLIVDASSLASPKRRSSAALLTGLTVHDACILWVCCAFISAYYQLPSIIVSHFGCKQELPLDLQWTSPQLEPVDRMTRLLRTAASTGLGCLSLDTNNDSDDEASRSRQAFAVNYVQCLAVSLGVDAAVSHCHYYLTLYPGCVELVVTCARFEQQLRGTEQGLGVFHEAVVRLKGTSGVHRLWNQYEGHALRWGGKDAALDVLARCGACEHRENDLHAGSSSSSMSDSTVDANVSDMQQSRARLSAIAQSYSSSWVEHAKGNRVMPGQDSVFSLLNLGLFEALSGDRAAAQVALENALKLATNDRDAEHCWKELASFTIFNWGQESGIGDNCLVGQHMLDLLDRCFTESRLICNLESLSQLADTIKKRRVRSFVKGLLGSSPTSYRLLNDILYATYGPTMLPGSVTSFQKAASFAEGILEIMPGNVVVALALCRLIAKIYDKSASVSADAAAVWASSLVAQSLVKSCPPASEMQWVEAANFLRRIGEPKALQEFCRHATQVYPFSVELGKLLEAS